MRDTTERSPDAGRTRRVWRRAGWFAVLYLAGLALTLGLTYGLRALLP